MHYIHYIDGYKYGIKIISYNHYEVLKNDIFIESFDTYEQAQNFIDSINK